jgi:RNA polymerase sigma factor (sigma-70 family)
MRTEDSDTALVLAARAGDREAFGALLARHRPVLVTLCARMLGDWALAEDAAQEAALRAFLGLDRLRRAERFGPWLHGIGLNVSRRWLAYRSRDVWSWEALHGGRYVAEPGDPRNGPEVLAEEADLRARVQRAVACLPRGQRDAVLLSYLAGLTQVETAAQLGIEVGAVKARLHKARRALRRELLPIWKEEVMATNVASQPVEMRVADLRRPRMEGDEPRHYVVVLEEMDSTRQLLIGIGPFEAEAIAVTLERVELPRPLPYTFTANLIQALGGRLREVRVNRLVNDTFYAVAMVEGSEGTREVDARPSDVLNLALVAGAPIRVDAAVFQAVEAAQQANPESVQRVQENLYGEGSQGPAEIVAKHRK